MMPPSHGGVQGGELQLLIAFGVLERDGG